LALYLLAAGNSSAADESAAAGKDDGFVPLFDGKSLAGWVNVNCAPETWTVRDGMLHCDGVPTGALRTERQYENFVLELEWRHLKPAGNAGVFIWAGPLSAQGQPFLRAIEVQVLEHAFGNTKSYTTHGDVFPIHGSDMAPLSPNNGKRSFPKERHGKPMPEWNHYRITCQDGSLRLAVNGHEVSGGDKCTWRKGYIALESEGGTVDWRNIRVKELPPSGAAPQDTAPLARKSVSLYDGRSLRGWKESPGWAPHDWQLRGAKDAQPLASEKQLPAQGELQFDFQWLDEPAAGAQLPVSLGGSRIAIPAPREIKKWHRVILTRKGESLVAEINGRAVQEQSPCASGAIALLPENGAAFAGVYVTGP
jgi:hypothetical protein